MQLATELTREDSDLTSMHPLHADMGTSVSLSLKHLAKGSPEDFAKSSRLVLSSLDTLLASGSPRNLSQHPQLA